MNAVHCSLSQIEPEREAKGTDSLEEREKARASELPLQVLVLALSACLLVAAVKATIFFPSAVLVAARRKELVLIFKFL